MGRNSHRWQHLQCPWCQTRDCLLERNEDNSIEFTAEGIMNPKTENNSRNRPCDLIDNYQIGPTDINTAWADNFLESSNDNWIAGLHTTRMRIPFTTSPLAMHQLNYFHVGVMQGSMSTDHALYANRCHMFHDGAQRRCLAIGMCRRILFLHFFSLRIGTVARSMTLTFVCIPFSIRVNVRTFWSFFRPIQCTFPFGWVLAIQ